MKCKTHEYIIIFLFESTTFKNKLDMKQMNILWYIVCDFIINEIKFYEI